jgi:hypothetical protein
LSAICQRSTHSKKTIRTEWERAGRSSKQSNRAAERAAGDGGEELHRGRREREERSCTEREAEGRSRGRRRGAGGLPEGELLGGGGDVVSRSMCLQVWSIPSPLPLDSLYLLLN